MDALAEDKPARKQTNKQHEVQWVLKGNVIRQNSASVATYSGYVSHKCFTGYFQLTAYH